MGARRTPDNLGYYGFNEALNAYYEVISYTKLLGDAKKRNRILFDKLNCPPLRAAKDVRLLAPGMFSRPIDRQTRICLGAA